ncbi:MAG: hypothetical protein ABI867_10765 [Kofleriaceae bacterium]
MTRVRTLLVVVLPSLLVGGLVFSNSSGYAAANADDARGNWPSSSSSSSSGVLVADNSNPRRVPAPPGGWGDTPPPAPPAPPAPPVAPIPSHGRHGGGGISISVHNGQIQINGIDDIINGRMEAVRQMMRNNPNIPKDIRDRVTARMDRVKAIVDRRLKNLKVSDLDRLDDELDKMGEELEQVLEGLDEDLAKLTGDKVGKDLAKQLKKLSKQKFKFNDNDAKADSDGDDNDDTDTDTDDTDNDSSTVDEEGAIEDLRGMTLKPAQRDQIAKLRTESEARVASAQQALDESSKRLETALADLQTSDAQVVQLVDQVSSHEAAIRKARLLAWIQARRVLDADQVKRIETATHKNHR